LLTWAARVDADWLDVNFGEQNLAQDLIARIKDSNAADDGSMVVHSDYLEVNITKA